MTYLGGARIPEDGSVALTFDLLRAPRLPALPGPRVAPADVAFAALVFGVEALLACCLPEGPGSARPGLLGWALLVGSAVVLVWRRRAPMWCMLGMVAVVAPYHYLENIQEAPLPSSMVALYALAVAGPPLRTFLLRAVRASHRWRPSCRPSGSRTAAPRCSGAPAG